MLAARVARTLTRLRRLVFERCSTSHAGSVSRSVVARIIVAHRAIVRRWRARLRFPFWQQRFTAWPRSVGRASCIVGRQVASPRRLAAVGAARRVAAAGVDAVVDAARDDQLDSATRAHGSMPLVDRARRRAARLRSLRRCAGAARGNDGGGASTWSRACLNGGERRKVPDKQSDCRRRCRA